MPLPIVSHCIAPSCPLAPVSTSLTAPTQRINGTQESLGTPSASTSAIPQASTPAVAPDSALHAALLNRITNTLLGESSAGADTTSLWFVYLGLPQLADKRSQAWQSRNDAALRHALSAAVRDTLPPSRARDALQMGLEEDLRQYKAPSSAHELDTMFTGAALRLAEYSLETEALISKHSAATPMSGKAFTQQGPGLAQAAPSMAVGITLAIPLYPSDTLFAELSRLGTKARELIPLIQEHHNATSAELRKKINIIYRDITEKLLPALELAKKGIALTSDIESHIQSLKDAIALFERAGWARSGTGQIHFDGGTWHLLDHRAATSISDLKKANDILNIVAKPVEENVFSKLGNSMMPSINNAKKERDEAASALTLKPSDSMTLATLHQKQADFNVLFQALSSALRNMQRMAENIINAIAR